MSEIIDSRKIEDLHPYIQSICKEHIRQAELKIPNSKVITTSTLRNQGKQTQLYNQGRLDKTKPIVTNAKLVKGHGFGIAYDLAVIINGKAIYSQSHLPKDYPLTYNQIWNIVGSIGESLGMSWAYRWKSFPETCHFDKLEGITTTQLHSGKRPSYWNKKSPLQILHSNKIISNIDSWEKWLSSPFIQGEIVKALIVNFYKKKTGKTDFIEAMDYMVKEKIISSKEYWLDNCVQTKFVKSEWVELIIERMASKIQ